MIWVRVMRGGLFMGWKAAAVGAALAGDLCHMIDICLGQTAAVIDCGNCGVQGEASVLAAAGLVAGLCSLALGVISGVAFHGGIYGLT